MLTTEITSACLDFPTVSEIIAPETRSTSLRSDTSRKAETAPQRPV